MRRGAARSAHQRCDALRRREPSCGAGRGGGARGAQRRRQVLHAGAAWRESCRSTPGRAECGGRRGHPARARRGLRAGLLAAARTSTSTAPCTASGARRSRSGSTRSSSSPSWASSSTLPVKVYSSGMYLRLGFSIAAHLDADVMLIDEILAVGDESFQRKCLARISERMEAGATLVLVSHDPSAIERVCRRVVVLDDGRRGLRRRRWPRAALALPPPARHARRAPRAACGPGERGALEVAELELLDADGRSRHVFRPGEPLRVADAAAARRRRPTAPWRRWRCAIRRGERCFRTDAALGSVAGAVEVSFDDRAAGAARAATTTSRWARTTRTRRRRAPRPPGALLGGGDGGRRGLRRPARHVDGGRGAPRPSR